MRWAYTRNRPHSLGVGERKNRCNLGHISVGIVNRWSVLTRPTAPFTSQRSGGNTLNKVTRSVCHFHRTSRTGSLRGRQQSENASDDDLSLESKRCSATRRTISSTRRASCMPGRVCQLQRYALFEVDVVVAWATLLGDRALELIIAMLALVSRTIAPSLRRFPTLSRSGLAFQRTMSEFKQVRTQKKRQIGDAHGSFRTRHRISELDFTVTKHPAIVHDLVVQVARYPRAHRDCR